MAEARRRSRRKSSRGSFRRATVLVAVVAMLIALGGQSAWAMPAAAGSGNAATPQQRSGSAAGKSHRAHSAIKPGKDGHKPVAVAGALPDAAPHQAPVKPHLSNQPRVVKNAKHVPALTVSKHAKAHGPELAAKRTAHTSVFKNADGSFTERVYPRSVHYKTSAGSWGNIDTSLVRVHGRWQQKANSVSATFAENGTDPDIATLDLGSGRSIGFGIGGASASNGNVSGSAITYPQVRRHADARYLALAGGGVKETLVLHGADAPTTWVFPLHLRGVTAAMGAGGSVVFTDSAGNVVDTIAHGFMRDSNINPRSDEGVLSTGVTYQLINQHGLQALRVSLDSKWLHDPARVFPVNVDPSVSNVNTSGSTYVMSPYNNDYNGGTTLDVGTWDGGSNIANSYLKFNVGSALRNDYIEAASLSLDEIWSYSCQARPVYVSPITSNWSVTGAKTYPWVSHSGAIGHSTFAAGYASSCPGPKWQSIDLGDNPSAAGIKMIESWAHGGANRGMALTASTTDSHGWKKFDSKNTPHPPYLSITYSPYGASYGVANGYTAPTSTASGSQRVTITNRGTSAWQPGSESLAYKLYSTSMQPVQAALVETALPVTVNPNQSVTVTGTIGALVPGQYNLCWDMRVGSTSFHTGYGVPTSQCTVINSENTPPQIDSTNPPSNVTVGSLTPQLAASGHDPDSYPGKGLAYDFKVYSVPTGGAKPSLIVDSGSQSSGDYVVPAQKLAWNKSYYWTVSDSDTLGFSGWSKPSFFTTTVPQPLITSHLGGKASDKHVDPGVGDYTATATDASVKAAGPKIAVLRSYNSLDPRTHALFGAGWSTVYDMQIIPDSDGSGNVVVTEADGHTARFAMNHPDCGGTCIAPSSYTFTPPQGSYQRLVQYNSNVSPFTVTYDLTDRHGTVYAFHQVSSAFYGLDGPWRLTEITDAAGRTQQLSYDGNGQLTTVTNGGGRSLHFTWANGHVAGVSTDKVVTGGQPLTWTYTYSDDYLTKVCPPTSSTACTGYGYTSGWTNAGSHYQSAVLDARPYAYWPLGDDQSNGSKTAADEVATNLGTKNGTYSTIFGHVTGPLPGTPDQSAYFGGNADVQLPDQLISSATYLTVQLWFQANSTGGVLLSTGHTPIFAANPSAGAMPVLYVGTDGKLYGQFWNGSVAPIVSSAAVNDNHWHRVTLTAAGTTQSMYLDGKAVGSQTGQLQNLDPMDFVGAGYVSGLPWQNLARNGLSLFRGNIAQVAVYHHTLGAPAIAAQYSLGTHAAPEITAITTPGGRAKAKVSYDDVTDRATKVTDIDGGSWTVAAPTTSGSSAEYRGAVIATDPTDFWPLDDSTGTQAVNVIPVGVLAPQSHGDGTYSNVTLGEPGPFPGTGDTAAGFNGTSSTLTASLPSYNLETSQSFGLWFKTTVAGGTLAEYYGNPYLYVGTDGKLYGGEGGTWVASPHVVTDGKWHFAVLSQGDSGPNTNATLYLDGKSVGTFTGPPPTLDPTIEQTATIGSGAIPSGAPAAPSSNPSGYFTGSIADIAFYSTAVTAGVVTAMDKAAHASSTSPTPITTAGVTDPGTHPVKYAYDPGQGGRLIAFTDGNGNTTRYSYDTGGFGNTTTYPDGNYITTTHNARGNVLSRTTGDSVGDAVTGYYTYPATGTYSSTDPRDDEPLTFSNPDSSGPDDTTYRTTYTYDSAGNLLTTTKPDGAVSTDGYTTDSESAIGGGTEPAGLLATQKDPLGHVTSYTYDAAGDVMKVVTPSGLTTTYTYDNLGRRLSKTVVSNSFPNGVTTGYSWDGDNRLLTQVGPASTDALTGAIHTPKVSDTYDADGNLLTKTTTDTTGGDAARTVADTYNTHDELAGTTDAAGRKSSYGYDAYGNRISVTDPAGNHYTHTYDADGHQLTTTLTNWTGNPGNPVSATSLVLDSRAYDPDGLLASDTNAMGRTTQYHYDYAERLTEADLVNFHDPSGTVETVQLESRDYDAAGNVLDSSNIGRGNGVQKYTYDRSGRLTSEWEPPSGEVDYTYNAGDQPTKRVLIDNNGNPIGETDYTYGPLGNAVSQAVHDGSQTLTTTAAYDQRGLQTSVTDPRGNVSGATAADFTTTNAYDAAGRLTTVTGPTVNGETGGGTPMAVHPITSYGYDTFGDKTSQSGPDGNITSYTYNPDGELIGTSGAAYTPPGSTTTITPLTKQSFTPLGRIASTTDPLGNVTTRTHDQLGDLVKVTEPVVNGDTSAWTYTYDNGGEKLSATDPTGVRTEATYDTLGEQLTRTGFVPSDGSTSPVPITTTYGYQTDQDWPAGDAEVPRGAPVTVTQPDGQQTKYAYDAAGDVTSITDPLGDVTGYGYDPKLHLSKITLPDGTATTYSYDEAGRRTGTAQLDASGTTLASTAATYDSAGNQLGATNADGVTTSYSYNAANRLIKQVQPLSSSAGITAGYGYDAAGQNTRYTDGNGNNTIYTYNSWQLPESTVEPTVPGYTSAADTTSTRTYNADGQLTKLTEPGGTSQTFGYDPLGRLTSQAGAGAEASTATRNFGYDLADRLTSVSTPTGTDTYTYSDRGLLTSAAGPSGTASFMYGDEGRLKSRTDAAGNTLFSYDAAGRLASMSDPLTGASVTYGRNKLGQVTGVNYGANGANQSFSYDASHRLTEQKLTGPGQVAEASVSYGYDRAGHVTGQATTGTAGAAASTYGYDEAGRLVSLNDGNTTVSYGYDNDGNRTRAESASATFNARDQVVSSTDGGVSSSYTYTARGTTATRSSGGSSAGYAYDAFGQLATVTSGSDSTSYTYDALGRKATAGAAAFGYDGTSTLPVGDGSHTFERDPSGSPVSTAGGGSAAFTLTNGHGDVTGLFTASGAVLVGSRAYAPYGRVTATAGTQSALGFQGGWGDPVTGDVGTASRWYDPAIGAFTSHDTVTYRPGAPVTAPNAYAYGGGDPIGEADPSGHFDCGWCRAIGNDIRNVASDLWDAASRANALLGAIQLGYAVYGLFNGHIGGSTMDGYNQVNPWQDMHRPEAPYWGAGGGRAHHTSRYRYHSRGRGGEYRVVSHRPRPPTRAEVVARRVYQDPINPMPFGQVHVAGETYEPGTKTAGSGPADEPPNTHAVEHPNPAAAPVSYNPAIQSADPASWVGGLPPAQVQLPDSACTGGAWRFNGQDWSKTSVVCEGGPTGDAEVGVQHDSATSDPYTGARQASKLLRDAGVPRQFRVQVMQSFEEGTIQVRTAGPADYGMRFYDNANAFARGRYLTTSWPATREEIAVKPTWNQFAFLKQWQIRPGAQVIEGRVGPQGIGYPGGGLQTYVLDPERDLLEPRR